MTVVRTSAANRNVDLPGFTVGGGGGLTAYTGILSSHDSLRIQSRGLLGPSSNLEDVFGHPNAAAKELAYQHPIS